MQRLEFHTRHTHTQYIIQINLHHHRHRCNASLINVMEFPIQNIIYLNEMRWHAAAHTHRETTGKNGGIFTNTNTHRAVWEHNM